jgi:hypothetical protein
VDGLRLGIDVPYPASSCDWSNCRPPISSERQWDSIRGLHQGQRLSCRKTGRTHDRTRPIRRNITKALAKRRVAVGTEISLRPPHRSRRALLTHRAPTLDGDEETAPLVKTASRMRTCACDTATRLCVRTVLCSSAFSLAPPLRSTSSATAETALFARFIATMSRSDFSITPIVGYGLRPSRRGPGHDWWGLRWRSPGSRTKGFCACQGLRRRGAGSCLAMTTRTILPSVGRKTSTPRTCLTPLNT